MINQKMNTIKDLSLFFIAFMIVHTGEVYAVNTILKNNYILALLLRLLIWTVPVFLLTMKQSPLKYLKLRDNILRGLSIGIIAGITLCVLRYIIIYLFKGYVGINLDIPVGFWLNGILFVGLSEEVVFRGYFLQKIESISTFWIANIISAFLFAIMHFPIWILVKNLGAFAMMNEVRSMVLMSLIFGYVFKKSKSLWSPIVMHSFNNFMSIAIN